jgi:hypothetical protein
VGKIRFAVLVAAALVGLDARAAGPPSIGIGEVTASSSTRDVDLGVLRAMVTDAVGTLDARTLPRGSAALLSVSVVRLESRAGSPAEVTCLVSATLRDPRRGTVFAVVEGSARGQDEPRRLAALERAILRAAVTSAVARVPDAMRRRPR